MRNQSNQTAVAGLSMLIILQAIMLMSLYAGVPPYPPAKIPLGGIAPILAAGFAASSAAIILGPTTSHMGRVFGLIAVVIAMLSFGPQKYLNLQLPLIWPAVVLGQVSAVMIVASMFRKAKVAALA